MFRGENLSSLNKIIYFTLEIFIAYASFIYEHMVNTLNTLGPSRIHEILD